MNAFRLLTVTAFLVASLPLCGQDRSADDRTEGGVPQTKGDWTLVWHDEFDGDGLDYSKWNIEVNAFGGGNQELQIYTDRSENVRVERGLLVIEARHDQAEIAGTKREYSSGRLRTKNRGDWKYGRIEVRAKLPTGRGMWPAIWMLPTDDRYGTWAKSGEIDIMELDGAEPAKVLGTLHHGDAWPNNTYTQGKFELEGETFHDDFHVFAVEWTEGEIKWFIDDQLYQTQTEWSTTSAKFPAPFDQRFHLLINLAVGGQFLDPPDATTPFPQRIETDYVRVYQ